jgi:hypothetical protein
VLKWDRHYDPDVDRMHKAVQLICLPVLPFLYCRRVLKWDRHYDPDMDRKHKAVQLAKSMGMELSALEKEVLSKC